MKNIFILLLFTVSLSAAAQSSQQVGAGHNQARLYDYRDYVKIAGVDSSQSNAEQILKDPRLVVPLASCEICGFNLSITKKGMDIIGPFFASGPKFTAEMTNAIRRWFYAPGDHLYIENIKMTCNGREREGLPILLGYKK